MKIQKASIYHKLNGKRIFKRSGDVCCLADSLQVGVFEPLARVWLVSQKSKEIQSSHNSFGEKHDCKYEHWTQVTLNLGMKSRNLDQADIGPELGLEFHICV